MVTKLQEIEQNWVHPLYRDDPNMEQCFKAEWKRVMARFEIVPDRMDRHQRKHSLGPLSFLQRSEDDLKKQEKIHQSLEMAAQITKNSGWTAKQWISKRETVIDQRTTYFIHGDILQHYGAHHASTVPVDKRHTKRSNNGKAHADLHHAINPINHKYNNINLILFYLVNSTSEFFGNRLFDNQLSRGILPTPMHHNEQQPQTI